jgi:hypothetical protein
MPHEKEPEKPETASGFSPRQLKAALLLAAAVALLIAARSCIGL